MGRQARTLTLREQLGQRMAVGFPGTELTEDFLDFLAEFKIGNLILFQRNIESTEQLKRLAGQLQKAVLGNTGFPAFIMIDQEGGPIVRLPQEAVNAPGAMALAATGNPENAYLAGQLTGKQLAEAGVNFDLAPVLDVNCNPDNPVIGVRSYGDTPDQAAAYGLAMMRGLLSREVVPCAKHFPGHGDTREDSHFSLPVVEKTGEELWRMELAPFRQAVKAGVPAIMTSHVVYPALEPKRLPATMSRAVITGLLREKLGYQGLVVSDSMEMAAIRKYYGTSEGVLAAFRAGVDIVLIPHSTERAGEAILMAESAMARGDLPVESMEESVGRIISCKAAFAGPKKDIKVESADRELEAELMRRTYTAVRLPQGKLPQLGENPFFVGCYAYQSSLVSNENDLKLCFPEWLANIFGGDAYVFSPDPTGEEIDRLVARAAGCSCIVAGTYNGHLRKGQRQLLEKLSGLGIPMTVFALRNPYELLELPETVAAIAVWEYTRRSLEGIRSMLEGRWLPEGKLPVTVMPKPEGGEDKRKGEGHREQVMELARELELPEEVRRQMADVMEKLPWESLEPVIKNLTEYDLASDAQLQLAKLTAPVEEVSGMGQLAGMLAAACYTRRMYERWGIPDSVFRATMDCFPRFLRETKRITGEWIYDRAFWTWRQTSGLLFRLGTLEFEYVRTEDGASLSVHIPSDASLTYGELEKSYQEAETFWERHGEVLCPFGKPGAVRCRTWLLSPELGRLLPEDSGIRRFAQGYEITEFLPDNESFYRWLFAGKKEWEELPEDTSLQRAVKAYLAAGGRIGIASGRFRGGAGHADRA